MLAYDIEMLNRPADRASSLDKGWCFGQPPGIKPEQWPLDPNNGYPLMHGFTVLLPEDYRCHGPEVVALSFFGTPWDMCEDGGPEYSDAIHGWFRAGAAAPDDPDLRFFYEAEQHRHPRLSRMEDCLGCAYAAIALTRAEFDGPLCAPPDMRPNRLRDAVARPSWLDVGAAVGFLEARDYRYIRRALGVETIDDRFYSQGIGWTPRETDPNAGLKPRDLSSGDAGDYQSYFYFADGKADQEHFRLHDWAKSHAQTHIGGTMRPVQGVPEGFGPFYLEFEEWFGGFNFGTGNAQLDFEHMKFDWACG